MLENEEIEKKPKTPMQFVDMVATKIAEYRSWGEKPHHVCYEYMNDALKHIEILSAGIEKFLKAEGHDLCQENRGELAALIGVQDTCPSKVSRQEFETGCYKYANEIYGELPDEPLYDIAAFLAADPQERLMILQDAWSQTTSLWQKHFLEGHMMGISVDLPEHPEGYENACMCETCRSYWEG